jgi:hypothetical protein
MAIVHALRIAYLVLTLIFLTSTSVRSEDCLPVVSAPSSVFLKGEGSGYDPFSEATLVEIFSVQVENLGEASCDLRLVFLNPDGQRQMVGGTFPLGYDLRHGLGGGSVLNESGLIQPSDGVTVTVPPRTARATTFQLIAPPNQFIASGSYADLIELQLQSAIGTVLERRQLSVEADVLSRAELAVGGTVNVGPGRTEVVDFGELESGEQKQVVLLARSNDKYVLHLTSAHGGRLSRIKGDPSFVSYEAFLDSKAIAFTGSGAFVTTGPFNPTPRAGQTKSLRFVIGDVTGRLAGDYADEIVITIRPDA